MPPISVILPVYNGASYLSESIESILKQTFRDFELLIINDASADNSCEIIKSFSDRRIVYLEHNQNMGLVAALNNGIFHSKGRYIVRMDQDDVSLPDRLAMQFDFMEKNPDCIVSGTQVKVIGGPGKLEYPLTDHECRVNLVFSPPFAHPAVIMRASTLKKNNFFYSSQFKDAEDYGFWVELSKFGSLANLPFEGLLYRRHSDQYTNNYKNGMNLASSNIRTYYLNSLGVKLEEQDQALFDIITQRRINYENASQIKAIGEFLGRFPDILKGSGLKHQTVQKKMYLFWRRICGEYEKKGKSAYRIFHSSPAATWGFDVKQRLSLLKNFFLLRN